MSGSDDGLERERSPPEGPTEMSPFESFDPDVTLDDMGGLEERTQRLRELVVDPLVDSNARIRTNGVLCRGPVDAAPGQLAEATVGTLRERGARVLVLRDDDRSQTPEHTTRSDLDRVVEVHETPDEDIERVVEGFRTMSDSGEPTALLLDVENHVLLADEHVRRTVSRLGDANAPVTVIAAAAEPRERPHPKSAQRNGCRDKSRFGDIFELVIDVPRPDAGRRASFLRSALEAFTDEEPFEADVSADTIRNLAEQAGCLSPAESRRVADVAAKVAQADDRTCIGCEDLRTALDQVSDDRTDPSQADDEDGEFRPEVPEVGFADVGGLDDVKQRLRATLEYPRKYPDLYAETALTPEHGVLLYGPPGTGKTLLAKALANESDRAFFAVKGAEFKSMWYGQSEQRVRDLFERAREESPSLVFFDELDSLAGARSRASHSTTENIVTTLLAELDGIEERDDVVVVGATNRPGAVDPAVRRPGRLGETIEVPPPGTEGRREIFGLDLRGIPTADDVTPAWCARQVPDGTTGAEIEAVVNRAVDVAIRAAESDDRVSDDGHPLVVRADITAAVDAVLDSDNHTDPDRGCW